ncbi:MAG: hypothetical protein JRN37_08445 [Nitrososphaerota archaeon]|nr:hypothetical protein [Nitrososphaerota archaeon]MDG7039161.1 hypothetical protein [Nitrososphaerota archaeon]MDG7040738.1 hypothetical protein [Nitrososphaerota archaeon]
MLEVKIESVHVDDARLNPCLLLKIHFKMLCTETVIGVQGMIIAPDNKIIAELSETSDINEKSSKTLQIKATQNFECNNQSAPQSTSLELLAPLSLPALDHLENVRAMRQKHDLELRIRLLIRLLRSKLVTAHLREIPIGSLSSALKELKQIQSTSGGRNIDSLVVYDFNPNYQTSRTNMWVLSSDGGATALEIATDTFEDTYRIPSDDWVHDFLPKLTGRRYAVVELPSLPHLSGKFAEVVSSIEEAKKQLYEQLDVGGTQTSLRNALNKLFEALKENGLAGEAGPNATKEIFWDKFIQDEKFRELLEHTYHDLVRAVTTGQDPTAPHKQASRSVEPYQAKALIDFVAYLAKVVFESLEKEANGQRLNVST